MEISLKYLKPNMFYFYWINWIHKYVSSTSYKVLINGSTGENFYARRSRKQGDPLSHFICILCSSPFG